MKIKTQSRLCLTNDEAKLLADKKPGDEVLFLRILNDQPPEGAIMRGGSKYIPESWTDVNLDTDTGWGTVCPYKSGRIGLTLTWMKLDKPNDEISRQVAEIFDLETPLHWPKYIIKQSMIDYANTISDFKMREEALQMITNCKWRSGVTMPKDAIRDWLEMTIECVRVQDITEDDIRIIGNLADYEWGYNCLRWFETHWNTAHAKPVKRKDGSGYVCYPYGGSDKEIDDVDWWLHFGEDITQSFNGKPTWWKYKGKPLTIIPNSWVWVIRGTLND